MKKYKIIASALLAGSIFVGAGYAAWTDQLNINNTVSTGNMNVEFIDANAIFPLEPYGNYVQTSINQTDPKTVVVTIDNLYPGTGALYASVFENKGTIPAVVDYVEVNFTQDNQLLKDKLVAVGGFLQARGSNIVDGGIFPGIFNNHYYLKDLQANLNTMLHNKRLEPGDKILLDIPDANKNDIKNILDQEGIDGYNPADNNCIIMGLPKAVGNNLEQQKAVFKIKLHFKQHNMQ